MRFCKGGLLLEGDGTYKLPSLTDMLDVVIERGVTGAGI